MGRVAKHKKLKKMGTAYDERPLNRVSYVDKDIDPYADDMPRSLKQMLHRKKMVEQKKKKPQKQSNPELPVFEDVRPGETVEDFTKRIDQETKGHLTTQWKETKRISQRKKKYYERRKETIEHRKRSKKRKRQEDSDDDIGEMEEEEEEESWQRQGGGGRKRKKDQKARSFSSLKDEVSFGEVAEQPPLLNRKNKRRKVSHEDWETDREETVKEKTKSMEQLQKDVQERYRERKKKLKGKEEFD
eukprot:CAMPEP_0201511304 /NCGR_PEP_ID=MMETSP0161_2-20130828/3787_1 /ASSEMBLY_ACC=CAM_ASM_000251 /TAXON_ID=180227 /ORGANISM="Neoparamoeba aestuarina, Strain SoJaBio B1-5/56/2" /LENGTH=243 /DNA_ID=CAMNT_0047906743 /DNA_START=33 /DNA_END=762 /DNA_ORIENTATION=+